MSESHRRQILDLQPEARDKTQTLLSLTGRRGDVPDPIGGSIAVYTQCLETMKPALDALADRLAGSLNGGTGPTRTRPEPT